MNLLPDATRARFGSWTTDVKLPPGTRAPGSKAADYAYNYLKNLIVTLGIPPRAIVTEGEVAEATGISRTPVREAFLRLQSERLLDMLPQRGAMVPEITLRNIQEQAQTRVVLEGYGIQKICENHVPVADELLRLIAEQRAIYEDDPERIVEMVAADKEFHWTLVRSIGNTEFAQLYNTLHDRQLRVGIALFEAVPARRCSAIEQHTKIAEAIRAFDQEQALQLLEKHLLESLNEVAGIFTN